MLMTMTTPMRSPEPLLTRCSSHDLLAPHPTQTSTSQSPMRSNSFVLSRRSGIVSERDALRLAATNNFDHEDVRSVAQPPARRPADNGLPPRSIAAKTSPSPWPAPVLRQLSNDAGHRRQRPLSTGYLLTNSPESQTQQRVEGHGPQTENSDDAQVWLRNVELLPNRQPMPQPAAESRWRQWNHHTAPRNGAASRPEIQRSTSWTGQNGEHGGGDRRMPDRESELRSTMEQNETAILRSMDDQRRVWEAELERRVSQLTDSLTERIRQLERENGVLQSAIVELQNTRNARPTDQQLATTRSNGPCTGHVDDTKERGRSWKQWLFNQKQPAGQNSNSAVSGSTRRTQNLRSGAELRSQLQTELNGDSTAIDPGGTRLPAIHEGPVTQCQNCEAVNSELERIRREFAVEREQWLTEKRRVIAYQKLLQGKYVQLQRRCAELQGSTATDALNHLGFIDEVGDSDAPGLRGGLRNSGHSQGLSPKLIPFGQSIET